MYMTYQYFTFVCIYVYIYFVIIYYGYIRYHLVIFLSSSLQPNPVPACFTQGLLCDLMGDQASFLDSENTIDFQESDLTFWPIFINFLYIFYYFLWVLDVFSWIFHKPSILFYFCSWWTVSTFSEAEWFALWQPQLATICTKRTGVAKSPTYAWMHFTRSCWASLISSKILRSNDSLSSMLVLMPTIWPMMPAAGAKGVHQSKVFTPQPTPLETRRPHIIR